MLTTDVGSIPRLVIEDHNKLMNNKFMELEMKEALFGLHLYKAPRPDGFPVAFFQKCWYFLGKETTEAIEDSRRSGKVLKEMNNTFVALIPKKKKT